MDFTNMLIVKKYIQFVWTFNGVVYFQKFDTNDG